MTPKIMFKKRIATLSLAALSASLLLTACGGGSGNTYDFTQINGMEPASSVKIEIPKKLIDVAGLEDGDLLVKSFSAKSHKLESGQYCAIDLSVDYADGAIDLMTVPAFTTEDAAKQIAESQKSYLSDKGASTAEELKQKYIKKVQEQADVRVGMMFGPKTLEEFLQDNYKVDTIEAAAASALLNNSSADAAPVKKKLEAEGALGTASVEKIFEAVNAEIEQRYTKQAEEAAAVPASKHIADALGFRNSTQISAFKDDADLDEGSYFSDDLKKVTLVQDCAASSYDEDAANELEFPARDGESITGFAEFALTVMKNGDLTIMTGEVDDWKVDSNGDWISS